VSDELHRDWIGKNVYPLDECTMAKKLRMNTKLSVIFGSNNKLNLIKRHMRGV